MWDRHAQRYSCQALRILDHSVCYKTRVHTDDSDATGAISNVSSPEADVTMHTVYSYPTFGKREKGVAFGKLAFGTGIIGNPMTPFFKLKIPSRNDIGQELEDISAILAWCESRVASGFTLF